MVLNFDLMTFEACSVLWMSTGSLWRACAHILTMSGVWIWLLNFCPMTPKSYYPSSALHSPTQSPTHFAYWLSVYFKLMVTVKFANCFQHILYNTGRVVPFLFIFRPGNIFVGISWCCSMLFQLSANSIKRPKQCVSPSLNTDLPTSSVALSPKSIGSY